MPDDIDVHAPVGGVGEGGSEGPADGVRRGTGRHRDEWFGVLDAWGGVDRPYREIAAWLTGDHGLSAWWAQKLAVEYQQARGRRTPGVRPDGTFTITVSRTAGVPVERLYEAFVDPVIRRRWLPGVTLRERTSRAPTSVRFDWEDGSTRVNAGFEAVGDSKSRVGLEHTGHPDPDAAAASKAFWSDRLAELDRLLRS